MLDAAFFNVNPVLVVVETRCFLCIQVPQFQVPCLSKSDDLRLPLFAPCVKHVYDVVPIRVDERQKLLVHPIGLILLADGAEAVLLELVNSVRELAVEVVKKLRQT